MTTTKRYDVMTWYHDREEFTPQIGVRRGPYTLFGLRKALRKLRDLGYETNRAGAFCVLVQRIEPGKPKRKYAD